MSLLKDAIEIAREREELMRQVPRALFGAPSAQSRSSAAIASTGGPIPLTREAFNAVVRRLVRPGPEQNAVDAAQINQAPPNANVSTGPSNASVGPTNYADSTTYADRTAGLVDYQIYPQTGDTPFIDAWQPDTVAPKGKLEDELLRAMKELAICRAREDEIANKKRETQRMLEDAARKLSTVDAAIASLHDGLNKIAVFLKKYGEIEAGMKDAVRKIDADLKTAGEIVLEEDEKL